MKKRLLTLVLAIWIVAALAGCQTVNNTQSQTSGTSSFDTTSNPFFWDEMRCINVDNVSITISDLQIIPEDARGNYENAPVVMVYYNVINYTDSPINALEQFMDHVQVLENYESGGDIFFMTPAAASDPVFHDDLEIEAGGVGLYADAYEIPDDPENVTLRYIAYDAANPLGVETIPFSEISGYNLLSSSGSITTSKPTATATPQPTEKPTTGESNALRSAKDYLKYMPFSYTGLIDQLEYEGYSTEEATYAVDNCGADWYEQAEKSAASYLKYSAFSYTGLIDQLEYEGYTSDQATQAADNCGADWFEQAVKCAESYLKYSSFSRDKLIGQLEYEGFTYEQAVYGAEENGY